MIMRVPFGDWSKDGHGESNDIWVNSPAWDTIPKAQEDIKAQYGEDFFKTFCEENDSYLNSIHWEAIYEAGYDTWNLIQDTHRGCIIYNGEKELDANDFDFTEEVIKHPEVWELTIDAVIDLFFILINEHSKGVEIIENPFPYNYDIETVGYSAY